MRTNKEGHTLEWSAAGGYCVKCGVKCEFDENGRRRYVLMDGTIPETAPICPFKDYLKDPRQTLITREYRKKKREKAQKKPT